ncbi:MAG: 3-dehydroquinate synthase family protein, partial [Spirochaetota bacterium]
MRRTFTFGTRSCTVAVFSRADLYEGLDGSAFCVADTNTERYLPSGSARHVLPAGETSKSWAQLELLLRGMLDADLTRAGRVVAVGGGVVCDIGALAASLYMRGCTLVLVPTSLLAMVDAAVGGKTGIDFGGYKNMVGSFYPASEVRICIDTLATLSEREYRSGLAEVIKTAMLGDGALLDTLERNHERVVARDPELLEGVVWACVEVKGGIVEADLT